MVGRHLILNKLAHVASPEGFFGAALRTSAPDHRVALRRDVGALNAGAFCPEALKSTSQ